AADPRAPALTDAHAVWHRRAHLTRTASWSDLRAMSTQGVGIWVLAATLTLAPDAAIGAALCAKQRSDGTFGSSVKIREACRAKEVQLAPQDVGFCCSATTTITTSTSLVCATTTTLGVPDCDAGEGCGFLCRDGRTCTDQG